MENTINYWKKRWQDGKTGWIQESPNPSLVATLAQNSPGELGKNVLVPLCGDSVDMTFLTRNGFTVHGIEASTDAIIQFFKNRIKTPPIEKTIGPFTQFSDGKTHVYAGNFFDLAKIDIQIDWVWDRAAFIAIEAQKRADYAKVLCSVLPVGGLIHLQTVEYQQDLYAGPPYSVDAACMTQHFSPFCSIEARDREDLIETSPKFKDLGASSFFQCNYLLTRTK